MRVGKLGIGMRSIAKGASCAGFGLHGGKPAAIELVREEGPLKIERDGVTRTLDQFRVSDTRLSTTIACDAFELRTVEHFFSALAGLGIRGGLRVISSGDELPLVDGGARAFAACIAELDLDPSPATKRVTRAEKFEIDGSTYEFFPSDETKVEVECDMPPSCDARASWDGDRDSFLARIAPARTFALERDVNGIAAAGLARHVDPKSVLVVSHESIFGAGHVERDEPARHKLLDLIGDAYFHGGPPRGTMRATSPGHARNHAALLRAIASGVIACAVISFSLRARAGDAVRSPTQNDLTHDVPELTVESTLASVTYNDAALQGTTYVRVERVAFEAPFKIFGAKNWYAGIAYDAALGHDDDGAPRFVSGNPEIWGRGVWTSQYGLSFGGGFSFVVPTGSYSSTDAAATTAFAAIAARGWDRALFDPNNATLRPFLDVRLVTGPITVQYRQSLEIATDFGDVAFRFAAVGTLTFGVRFSPLVSATADVIEYYRLDPGLDDDARPYFAVGAHVLLDTKFFRPSIGIMTNIGSPLNAISQIGAPLQTAPTSFVGVHFSLAFPIAKSQRKNK